ncbi:MULTISPECIES: hypothetical protein [unclassified Wolbachia]|uniref:hypothetical protein n=1 Tax=unclassified Wolbachia TaxID=2640676 RepID=UPI00222E523B|nr:hypothetical protein [Wolbachia endosymbiont (group A) of Apoderus coryli]
MNRKEALKILGFSEGDNPEKWELKERHQEKWSFTYRELTTAFDSLSEQFIGPDSRPFDYVDLDDDINSLSDLQSVFGSATFSNDIEYLKKLFSKFKSSKNGQFGDYINQPYEGENLLYRAVSSRNIEIVELFLKNGADPNTKINGPYVWDSEVEKLLVEYGKIDKSNVFHQLVFAVLISCVAFAMYSSCDASFSCYAGVAAFALAGVLLVAKTIHDVFYVQTKWPSPNFDEVNAEQVINNVEDNSKRIDNALA